MPDEEKIAQDGLGATAPLRIPSYGGFASYARGMRQGIVDPSKGGDIGALGMGYGDGSDDGGGPVSYDEMLGAYSLGEARQLDFLPEQRVGVRQALSGSGLGRAEDFTANPTADYGTYRIDRRITDPDVISDPERLAAARAALQSGGRQFGNALVKGLALVGTTAGDTVLGGLFQFIQPIIDAASGKYDHTAEERAVHFDANGNRISSDLSVGEGVLSSMRNNFFTSTFMSFNDWLEEKLPNFVDPRSQDMNLWQQMGTANFWGNEVLKGLGMLGGALISAMLLNRFAMPRLTGLNRYRNVIKEACAIANVSKSAVSSAKMGELATAFAKGEFGPTAKAMTQAVSQAGRAMKTTEISSKLVGSFLAATGEGRMISYGAQEQFYKSAVQRLTEMRDGEIAELDGRIRREYPQLFMEVDGGYGRSVTVVDPNFMEEYVRLHDGMEAKVRRKYSDMEKVSRDQAIRVGNAVFVNQLPIIFATDLIGWGSFLSGGFKATRAARAFAHVGKNGVAKASAGRLVWGIGKGLIEQSMGPVHMGAQHLSGAIEQRRGEARMNEFYGMAYSPEAVADYLEGSKGWGMLAADIWRGERGGTEFHKSLLIGEVFSLIGLPIRTGRTRVRFEGKRVEFSALSEKQRMAYETSLKEMGWLKRMWNTWDTAPGWAVARETVESVRRYREGQRVAEVYNKYHQSDAFRSMYEAVARGSIIVDEKERALMTGDKRAYLTAEEKELLNVVSVFSKLRRTDELVAMMDDLCNTEPDAIRDITRDKKSGNSPFDNYTDDQIRETMAKRRDALKRRIREYTETSNNIRSAFGQNMDDSVVEELTWYVTHIDNLNERFSECYDKLRGFLFDGKGAPLSDTSRIRDDEVRAKVERLRDMSGMDALAAFDVMGEQEVHDLLAEFERQVRKEGGKKAPLVYKDAIDIAADLQSLYAERIRYADTFLHFAGDHKNVARLGDEFEEQKWRIIDASLLVPFGDPQRSERLRSVNGIAEYLREVMQTFGGKGMSDNTFEKMMSRLLAHLKTDERWAEYRDYVDGALEVFNTYRLFDEAIKAVTFGMFNGEGSVAQEMRQVIYDGLVGAGGGEGFLSADDFVQVFRDRANDRRISKDMRDVYDAVLQKYEHARMASKASKPDGGGKAKPGDQKAGADRQAARDEAKKTADARRDRVDSASKKAEGNGSAKEAEKPSEEAGKEVAATGASPERYKVNNVEDAVERITEGMTADELDAMEAYVKENVGNIQAKIEITNLIRKARSASGLTVGSRSRSDSPTGEGVSEASGRRAGTRDLAAVPKGGGKAVLLNGEGMTPKEAKGVSDRGGFEFVLGGSLGAEFAKPGDVEVRFVRVDGDGTVYAVVEREGGAIRSGGREWQVIGAVTGEAGKELGTALDAQPGTAEGGVRMLEGEAGRLTHVGSGKFGESGGEPVRLTREDAPDGTYTIATLDGGGLHFGTTKGVRDGVTEVAAADVDLPDTLPTEAQAVLLVRGGDGRWVVKDAVQAAFRNLRWEDRDMEGREMRLTSAIRSRIVRMYEGETLAERLEAALDIATLIGQGGEDGISGFAEVLSAMENLKGAGAFYERFLEGKRVSFSSDACEALGVTLQDFVEAGAIYSNVTGTRPQAVPVVVERTSSVRPAPKPKASTAPKHKPKAIPKPKPKAASKPGTTKSEEHAEKAKAVERSPESSLGGTSGRTVTDMRLNVEPGSVGKEGGGQERVPKYVAVLETNSHGNGTVVFYDVAEAVARFPGNTEESVREAIAKGTWGYGGRVSDPTAVSVLKWIYDVTVNPQTGDLMEGSDSLYVYRRGDGTEVIYDMDSGRVYRKGAKAGGSDGASEPVGSVDPARAGSALEALEAMLGGRPAENPSPESTTSNPEVSEARERQKREEIERREMERRTGTFDPQRRMEEASRKDGRNAIKDEFFGLSWRDRMETFRGGDKRIIEKLVKAGLLPEGSSQYKMDFNALLDSYEKLAMEHTDRNGRRDLVSLDAIGSLKDFIAELDHAVNCVL